MTSPSGRWIAENAEVFYPGPGFVAVTEDDINWLKRQAMANARGRCRFCLHATPDEMLHDMVIALKGGSYDRPHRHMRKRETLQVIQGEGFYIEFGDDGRPLAARRLSASGDEGSFRILRTLDSRYHGLLIESEMLVFSESTLGPFDPNSSEFASWSPEPNDRAAVERYIAYLTDWARRAA